MMSDLMQELSKEARKLSAAERIQLVDDILSSLNQTDPGGTQAGLQKWKTVSPPTVV